MLTAALLAARFASSPGLTFAAIRKGSESSRRHAALGGVAALFAAVAPAVAEEAGDLYATFKVDLDGAYGKGAEKEVRVRLRPDWAPRGVRRFEELVRIGEMKESAVYHVDEVNGRANFGLPAEPTLMPAPIKDDQWKMDASNKRGTLSFASVGEDSRANELFFNTGNNLNLDKRGFTPIGEVVGDGMDVVDKFYAGYGNKVDRITILKEGNEYLDASFPKLSKIISVDINY